MLTGQGYYLVRCEECKNGQHTAVCIGKECPVIMAAIIRLNDYEETGLSPENVQALKIAQYNPDASFMWSCSKCGCE